MGLSLGYSVLSEVLGLTFLVIGDSRLFKTSFFYFREVEADLPTENNRLGGLQPVQTQ